MNDQAQYAGHRLIRFSPKTRRTLAEIADRLIPRSQEILDKWVAQQFQTWEPPNFTRESLSQVFSNLLDSILQHMRDGDLEACVDDLEQTGANLAQQQFPFDALVISVHFLEESYMPVLLNPPPPEPRTWLVEMDEFLHVALAAIANAYFEAHREELLERVEVGRIVQECLMPNIPRRVADLDVAHIYISAQEKAQLGGDFLDAFETQSGEHAFVIGDLSGHGLDAAAGSVMLRSMFRGFMREQPELGGAMGRLDHVLSAELTGGQFASALAVTYRPDGRIALVNAGHPAPVLYNDHCEIIEDHGSILALGLGTRYQASEHYLEPGGLFVAYTDGLIEARSRGELFGETRLAAAIAGVRDAPARAVVSQLVDAALRHAGGRFSDDIAILVLKRQSRS